MTPVRGLFLLLVLLEASAGAGASAPPASGSLPTDLVDLSDIPASAGRDEEVERRLRQAVVSDDDTRYATNILGWWLFSRDRSEEARPFLERSCVSRRLEKACAAASAIYLALGDWEAAMGIASRHTANACVESDRLRAVTLLGTPRVAVTAGEGLVRLAQDDEMSYLVLAAAWHRAGDEAAASRVLADGAAKARRVRVLKLVRWSRPAGRSGTHEEGGRQR